MAVWYARVATNVNAANVWNSAANGSGSWLTWPPASGDVLMANGFNVTVNVNTNLGAPGQVRTDTANGAATGGRFAFANGVSLTANAYAGATTQVLFFNVASAFFVGNIYAGSGSSIYGVNAQGSGTLQITGNVYAGTNTNCVGVMALTGSPTINMTGDLFGGTATNARGAVALAAGSTITLVGNATSGLGSGAAGVENNAGVVTVSGYAQASTQGAGAVNSAQGILQVGETRSASNGIPAVIGAFRYASATALIHKPIAADGSVLTMKPVSAFTLPSEATVRNGVSYGADKVGTLTGCNRHHRMSV